MVESRVLKYACGVLVGVAIVVAIGVLLMRAQSGSSDDKGLRVADSLKFLIVISRHGNRGAHMDYPNDPYPINDTRYWPYGNDGLTPAGRVEMYKLGVRIRSLYNGFLNSTFYSEEIRASSTYMDRMLMSGECFLAGLYPPKGFQVWDKSIPWQPTPLYTDSPDKTVVINNCPKYQGLIEAVKAEFFQTYAANISEINSIFSKATGSNASEVETTVNVFQLWDKLISEVTEGYEIPEWTKQLYPQPLQNLIAEEYIQFYAGLDEIVRLLVGTLFREMTEAMTAKTNGTLKSQRMQYYSGHDSSIVSLQVLLGIPKTSVIGMVKPGSALVLEVHQNSTTSRYTLQVLFIDGSSADLDPVTLEVPNCGDPCDFLAIVNNTRLYTDVDYDIECLNSTFHHYSKKQI